MGTFSRAELIAALDAGRATWPFVEVPEAVFAAWISDRLTGDGSLTSLNVRDLYLACACANGDERALGAFEKVILTTVDPALRRLGMSADTIEETKQVLRERLFVPEADDAPRIATYSGRGDLRSWVRVAAVRAAFRVVRVPKGQAELESAVVRGITAPLHDPELEYLKRTYARMFEDAVRDAFGALPPRARNILRYYYAERLTIDAIGAVYRAHRATAARWVQQAVEVLTAETRRIMVKRAAATESELSSMLRFLRSIDEDLETVLATVLVEPRGGSTES